MKALVLDQIDNRTVATVKDIDLPALAEGDVPGRHRLVESQL
ncbi:quinone oxidoreductase [Klebsiella pneumoniae]|uniref:Quinone oxidoreductase n=1 Tax=Klebsiella pneumoniae TaxID=573 RepID=A0A378AR39_KLEPN|nr:quinone oxidoreductase [Klebsiella pneumoniae]